MKKWVYVLFGLAVLLVLTGCQSARGADGRPSGNIVIYTSMYAEAIESIQKELARQFPGITVTFISRGTGIIEGLINAEEASGRLGCDILMVAEPSYSIYLKEKGMLHSFKSREAANLAFEYDTDGYWYPVRVSIMALAYNPERHPLVTLPVSFQEWSINSRARGAISMRNPIVSGTTLAAIAALRSRYGYEYFDNLGRQGVMIDYGSAETIRRLGSGESHVSMILEESILRVQEKDHAKLEVLYPSDGVVVIPSAIMIVNNQWSANRNIPAAEAIAEWFLGVEGQNAIVGGWMHSVRTGFDKQPYGTRVTREMITNSMPVNWEDIVRNREHIRLEFERRVSSYR